MGRENNIPCHLSLVKKAVLSRKFVLACDTIRYFNFNWYPKLVQAYNTVCLYGCETWSLTLREEHRLRVFLEQGVEENIWTEER
jgi:hypothetical protein